MRKQQLPLILTIIISLLAFSSSYAQETTDIERLEARVRSISRGLTSVEARQYVDTFFELAQAYINAGRTKDAINALRIGLSVQAWDYNNQLKLAQLELFNGEIDPAFERISFVLKHARNAKVRKMANDLLKHPALTGYQKKEITRPELKTHTLYVLAYPGVHELIAEAIAANVSKEFGINVEIINETEKPNRTRIRSKYSPETTSLFKKALYYLFPMGRKQIFSRVDRFVGDQYNTWVLMNQIADMHNDSLSQPYVLGILGITHHDIYEKNYNYLFGTSFDRVGIMSYARFYDEYLPWEITIKRAIKQAFSTTGFIIGIPRCTTADCARAYPHMLAEHDRKGSRLCPICLENLRKNYERRR